MVKKESKGRSSKTKSGSKVRKSEKIKLPKGVTLAKAKSHEIAPARLKKVEIEEVDPKREKRIAIKIPRRAGKKLNLNKFGLTIHNALRKDVTGYILQVRRKDKLVQSRIWNWAQTPADKKKGWTQHTQMHLASVSKFLTAVGTVRALQDKGRSYNTKIINYLPSYWVKGKNIDKITFRHLLTHRSGFNVSGSSTDFKTMKKKVAAGVSASKIGKSKSKYENMNFGLCRILIPVMRGDVPKGLHLPFSFNDAIWDIQTVNFFRKFMQSRVFSPAGVPNVGFVPKKTGNALAYRHPHLNRKGWNSGDLRSVAGGAGFRLSSRQLLRVMHHVRRRNTIISASKARYMLKNGFGIDQIINTTAGKIYNKNGLWRSKGRTEQCVVYFLPNDMELTLFVNSPIGLSGASLRNLVRDAFKASLS